ncbi:DMT family transporter [Aestuariibacter salexigens]|uniref:DMT family transporter n=1 Tax=Aestuariibacter salexigens TaxID=226010 RepID=UPI0004214378|nr:DMT family transporter [Aestuariibacter salexigens]
MKPIFAAELILLAAIWGASFLFMRGAVMEMGEFVLVEVRTLIAALMLIPLLVKLRLTKVFYAHWKPIFIVGLVNTAIPFCLFAYAMRFLDAGFTSILNATAPMFGVLVAWLYLHEKLTWKAVIGLLLGFSGVCILSLEKNALTGTWQLLPIASALGATFFYGVGASYTKKHLTGVPSMVVASGSQLFAAIALLPTAILYWPASDITIHAWSNAAALGVFGTGFAYILYFHLITNIGAGNAMTVAYLVPVFGVFWSVLFVGEVITPGIALGATIVLIGVALSTGMISRRQKTAQQ